MHQGCTRLSSDPDETFFGLPRMSSFAGRFTTAGHPGRYLVFADKDEVVDCFLDEGRTYRLA